MSDRDRSCEERVQERLESRLEDLRTWFGPESIDTEARLDGDGSDFYEYGLGFWYTAPGTFEDQNEGYWCYQLSWGGPGDEFRFFSSGPEFEPYRVEYWFLDWWDGAKRILTGEDLDILLEVWAWFEGAGTTAHAQQQALETL